MTKFIRLIVNHPAFSLIGMIPITPIAACRLLYNIIKDKAKKEELDRAELSRLLHESADIKRKVEILDEWIWIRRRFTRKERIVDALKEIIKYWKRNDEPLRRFLGDKSIVYQALHKLYHLALQNEYNQQPEDGKGTWEGIAAGQTDILGYQIGQLFDAVIEELKNKRG